MRSTKKEFNAGVAFELKQQPQPLQQRWQKCFAQDRDDVLLVGDLQEIASLCIRSTQPYTHLLGRVLYRNDHVKGVLFVRLVQMATHLQIKYDFFPTPTPPESLLIPVSLPVMPSEMVFAVDVMHPRLPHPFLLMGPDAKLFAPSLVSPLPDPEDILACFPDSTKTESSRIVDNFINDKRATSPLSAAPPVVDDDPMLDF
jgi:hypothetical protein